LLLLFTVALLSPRAFSDSMAAVVGMFSGMGVIIVMMGVALCICLCVPCAVLAWFAPAPPW